MSRQKEFIDGITFLKVLRYCRFKLKIIYSYAKMPPTFPPLHVQLNWREKEEILMKKVDELKITLSFSMYRFLIVLVARSFMGNKRPETIVGNFK